MKMSYLNCRLNQLKYPAFKNDHAVCVPGNIESGRKSFILSLYVLMMGIWFLFIQIGQYSSAFAEDKVKTTGNILILNSYHPGYLWSDDSPLFPFGHGLSYTTFEYKNLQVTPAQIKPDGQAIVRVEVTNTGRRAGDEVVQLYIHDILTERVTRPVKELKGFRRITLQPGERQVVECMLNTEALSYLNERMVRVVEPGMSEVMVGTSSADVQTVQLKVEK